MTSPLAEPADPDRTVGASQPADEPTAEGVRQESPATERTDETAPYDAVVLVSFGGPEAPEEVMPFLRRVTRGRGIPDERLEEVAEHYHHFGGRSPINDQNRALMAALRSELDRRGIQTPLSVGQPQLRAVRDRHPPAVRTSGDEAPRRRHDQRLLLLQLLPAVSRGPGRGAGHARRRRAHAAVDKVRQYWNHPGFSAVNVAWSPRPSGRPTSAPARRPRVVCVTHSIPDAMDDTSGPGDEDGNLYSAQHQARLPRSARRCRPPSART